MRLTPSLRWLCVVLMFGACTGEKDDGSGTSETSGDSTTSMADGGPTGTEGPDGADETDTTQGDGTGTGTVWTWTGNSGSETDPEPGCGNGRLESGEQCDDGNMEDGDGCSGDCTLPPGTLELQYPGVMLRALAASADGSIVAAGSTGGSGADVWAVKVTVDGQEVWTKSGADDADIGRSASGVTLADDGSIFVVGGDNYDDVSGRGWIARLDADGGEIWARSFVYGSWGRAQAVTLWSSSDVYVTGMGGSYVHWMRRYDRDGTLVWEWSENDAEGYDIGIDALGGAYTTGGLYGATADGMLRKIGSDGAQQWTLELDAYFAHLVTDPDGNSYVAREVELTQLRARMMKVDAVGTIVWDRDLVWVDGATSAGASGLALDDDGNVHYGFQALWEGSRFVKVTPDGDKHWEAAEPAWRVEDVAIDAMNRMVFTGWDVAGANATSIIRAYDTG